MLAASLAALDLLADDPGRVDRLAANADVMRASLRAEGLDAGPSSTQIIPVTVGDAAQTMALSERILERAATSQEGVATLAEHTVTDAGVLDGLLAGRYSRSVGAESLSTRVSTAKPMAGLLGRLKNVPCSTGNRPLPIV